MKPANPPPQPPGARAKRPRIPWEDNPVSIKYYVKRFIQRNQARLANKVVIDTPAGSGITAQLLKNAGASVHAYDLFPEYFKVKDVVCERANIVDGLPAPDEFADFLICQEGIEHFSDQYRALKEFNRVLKMGGSLIVTTPNYSNLQSRLSYFVFETEYLLKKMPPNEFDSVWMSDASERELYLGHYFLIGIQRLRGLAKLCGFRIKDIVFTQASNTSVALLPFAYPLLFCAAWWTYYNHSRRNRLPLSAERKEGYRELMSLNTNLSVLVSKTLFVEFEKEAELRSIKGSLISQHESFDVTP